MHPDIHQKLIGKDESVEDMTWNNLGHSITEGGILPKMRDAFATAFIPNGARWRYITKDFSQDRRIDIHFARNVPDLSVFTTTEDRLNAVTKLLSYDINEALAEVLVGKGISLEEFENMRVSEREQFSNIHRQAGILYAENNLNGIIMDVKHHGENNLYRNRPDLGNIAQTTDSGLCTGDSYARSYITGLGASLRKNREIILNLAFTPSITLSFTVNSTTCGP